MALNIPLPGDMGDAFLSGMDTTSSVINRLLQPRIAREKMEQEKQQAAINNARMQQELAQRMKIHQDNYGLSKQAQDRLSQMFPFQLQALQDKHMKAMQSPLDKNQEAINRAITIDEAKSNRKKLDEIEGTAKSLMPYLGKVNTIGDILERKPELAGRVTQLADLFGMTKDEDVGKFLSAAQSLQAHMAKEMSSRGGYGVSKLVEQAKPNLGKSTAYNKGVIQELRQGMKDSFEQMKDEYERLSGGQKFPYNFEQYFQEQTGGSTPNENKKRLKFNPATGRLE